MKQSARISKRVNTLALTLFALLVLGSCGQLTGSSGGSSGSSNSSGSSSSSGLTVESIAPNDGSSGVPLDPSLEVTFSETIDPDTALSGGITVSGNDSTISVTGVDGSFGDYSFPVGYGDTPLAPGTQYTVVVSTDVTSSDGTALSEKFSSTFTTTNDTTAPTVSAVKVNGTTKNQDATGISTDAPTITATFSEEIRKRGQDATQYVDANDNTVSHSVSTSGNTLTVKTEETLSSNTDYTLIVNVVEDMAGHTLSGSDFRLGDDFRFAFTTQ